MLLPQRPSPQLHLAHIPILKLVCYLCLEWTPEKLEFCVWACDRVSLSRRAALRDRGGAQRVVLKGVQVTFADTLCSLEEGLARHKGERSGTDRTWSDLDRGISERGVCAPISSRNLLVWRVVSYIYAPGRSRRANNTLFATPDVTLISLLPHCIRWEPCWANGKSQKAFPVVTPSASGRRSRCLKLHGDPVPRSPEGLSFTVTTPPPSTSPTGTLLNF